MSALSACPRLRPRRPRRRRAPAGADAPRATRAARRSAHMEQARPRAKVTLVPTRGGSPLRDDARAQPHDMAGTGRSIRCRVEATSRYERDDRCGAAHVSSDSLRFRGDVPSARRRIGCLGLRCDVHRGSPRALTDAITSIQRPDPATREIIVVVDRNDRLLAQLPGLFPGPRRSETGSRPGRRWRSSHGCPGFEGDNPCLSRRR